MILSLAKKNKQLHELGLISLGKEGEHAFVLDLTSLTAAQKEDFTTGLKKVIIAGISQTRFI